MMASPAFATAKKAETPVNDPQNTYKMLNLFGDVFDRVRRDYVEETNDEELVKSAINGMLTSLDPHSSYLSEKDFKEMQVQTKGEFGGLGIEVTMENGMVKVVSPIDETPAAKAGILSGDFISHIDDEAVMGLTLPEAVEKMRGKIGSQIKVTILREGAQEPLNFTLTRENIKIESVASRAEDDIAYIRVRSFSENTHPSVVREIEKLKKSMPEIRGIVLDLRNNPGGLLDQAIAVSDDFLEKGEIVSTRGRDPENTVRYNAKEGAIVPDSVPVVVLVNNGSASASEIVAGALQDHKRAIVLGTDTFGKGSVQTVIPLNNHGAMRLTTARYYTPSGRSIQAEGIKPDIFVEPAKVEPITQNSAFGTRSEASLRGHLDKGKTATNAAQKAANEAALDAAKTAEETDGKPEGAEGAGDTPVPAAKTVVSPRKLLADNPIEDYQLSRALDLLRGLAFYKTEQ
ncbi:MAG: S41 family peptidase [Alphaproteobacteria bacterium]|nr:S41 family peptidase [Alphaproteobacteria bacterium]